jgi:hypothetical protein
MNSNHNAASGSPVRASKDEIHLWRLLHEDLADDDDEDDEDYVPGYQERDSQSGFVHDDSYRQFLVETFNPDASIFDDDDEEDEDEEFRPVDDGHEEADAAAMRVPKWEVMNLLKDADVDVQQEATMQMDSATALKNWPLVELTAANPGDTFGQSRQQTEPPSEWQRLEEVAFRQLCDLCQLCLQTTLLSMWNIRVIKEAVCLDMMNSDDPRDERQVLDVDALHFTDPPVAAVQTQLRELQAAAKSSLAFLTNVRTQQLTDFRKKVLEGADEGGAKTATSLWAVPMVASPALQDAIAHPPTVREHIDQVLAIRDLYLRPELRVESVTVTAAMKKSAALLLSDRRPTARFSNAEDRILVRQLLKGHTDLKMLSAVYLPCKTPRQILTHIKNEQTRGGDESRNIFAMLKMISKDRLPIGVERIIQQHIAAIVKGDLTVQDLNVTYLPHISDIRRLQQRVDAHRMRHKLEEWLSGFSAHEEYVVDNDDFKAFLEDGQFDEEFVASEASSYGSGDQSEMDDNVSLVDEPDRILDVDEAGPDDFEQDELLDDAEISEDAFEDINIASPVPSDAHEKEFSFIENLLLRCTVSIEGGTGNHWSLLLDGPEAPLAGLYTEEELDLQWQKLSLSEN